VIGYRKTPLMTPHEVRGSSSQSPGRRVFMISLMYCFIVFIIPLCCPPALRNIFHTPMARYSLFVLKVPINTKQLTN